MRVRPLGWALIIAIATGILIAFINPTKAVAIPCVSGHPRWPDPSPLAAMAFVIAALLIASLYRAKRDGHI